MTNALLMLIVLGVVLLALAINLWVLVGWLASNFEERIREDPKADG